MSEGGGEGEGGEWRVGGRGPSVQQESGQLMDDIGEGGEGECGIDRMATLRRRRRRGQRRTIGIQRRSHDEMEPVFYFKNLYKCCSLIPI